MLRLIGFATCLMLDQATGIVPGTLTSARLPLTYTAFATDSSDAYTKLRFSLTVAPPPAGYAVTGAFCS